MMGDAVILCVILLMTAFDGSSIGHKYCAQEHEDLTTLCQRAAGEEVANVEKFGSTLRLNGQPAWLALTGAKVTCEVLK